MFSQALYIILRRRIVLPLHKKTPGANLAATGGKGPEPNTHGANEQSVYTYRLLRCTMRSISRSKIDKQFRGDRYVAFWRSGENFLPVPCWYRVISTPLSSPFPWYTKIRCHIRSSPYAYNFTKTIHSVDYGVFRHKTQGVIPQCFILLNRGKYPL